MEIQTGFITYKDSCIEYRKLGQDKPLIVLFHGFGDKAALFDPILNTLSQKFEVWAISLPYHGHTDWQEGTFSKDDINWLINYLLRHTNKERLSLLGYSMGGKIVLNMLQDFASITDQVILLAPDGIKTHLLYDIHSVPLIYINFFKFLMKRPRLFFKTAKFFYKKRLLTKFLYDFTKNHFSTAEQRQRFFMVSDSIRTFKPNLTLTKTLLKRYQIPVNLFLGVRDEVILPETAKIFSVDLQNCSVKWLDKGHLLVDEDLNEPLLEAIKKKTIY